MNGRQLAAIALGILAVGLTLRAVNLGSVPADKESLDEYYWTWTGMGLLEDGVPRGWSVLPIYDDAVFERVHWKGEELTVVEPAMDHPPLYSLYMGVWMRALGYRDLLSVDLTAMRASSLLLFVLAYALFFLLLRQVTEPRETVVALVVMALSTPIVVNSKLVVSENFFVIVVLGTLYVLLRHLDGGRRRWLALTAVGALCLPLCKVAALGFSLALFFIALARKDRLASLVIVGSTALGLLAYLVYGHVVGGETFVAALQSQAARFQGFTSAFNLLLVPKIVDQPVTYGLFFLALAALLTDGDETRKQVVVIPLVTYACAMGFFANKFLVFGWYLIPLYPFLCIGVSRALVVMWRDRSGWMIWLWLLLVVPFSLDILTSILPGGLGMLRYVYLFLIIAMPAVVLWGGFSNATARRSVVATLVGVHLACDMILLFHHLPGAG